MSKSKMNRRISRIRREEAFDAARCVVEQALGALPQPLQRRAEAVAVSYYWRPSKTIASEGIASDTMGMFSGPGFREELMSADPYPPRIYLFLGNIAREAKGDIKAFRREVRRTYLHELGHYLGLDEDALEARGLG